jgi:hypothetical protein
MCHAGWNEKGGTQTQESELKQGTIINISIPNMLTYQQSFSLLPRLNTVFFFTASNKHRCPKHYLSSILSGRFYVCYPGAWLLTLCNKYLIVWAAEAATKWYLHKRLILARQRTADVDKSWVRLAQKPNPQNVVVFIFMRHTGQAQVVVDALGSSNLVLFLSHTLQWNWTNYFSCFFLQSTIP